MKTDFIAPPWPHVRGDSICAHSLVSRIEKNAHHGCGLHYELYNYRALSALNDVLANLSAGDAATFITVAASRGFHLNEIALRDSSKAYQETMDEIMKDQL